MIQSDDNSIKQAAARGVVWVTLTSGLAVFLAYYRNWMLGHIGTPGEIVGVYALLLLFINIVVTFVMFGGVTAVTNFLPKISRREDKAGFLLSYGSISAATITVFVIVILVWPQALNFLMRRPISSKGSIALAGLTPIVLCSQVVTYSLAGLMAFRLAAVLAQTQLYLISILATLAYFIFPELFARRGLVILTLAVAAAHVVMAFAGGYYILKNIGLPKHFYLPPNFWRFTTFVHIQTLCSFAYGYLDQILVASTVGIRELGAYFVMHQCAHLVSFVASSISKIMLASFSNLAGNGQYERLKSAYKKLCRILVIFSTTSAFVFIFFSQQVAGLFGDWFATKHMYLILLTCGFNVANIGSVNAMLVLSNEKAGDFLVNSLIQIAVQLVLTFLLMPSLGVYGIILAKMAGLAAAQVGLYWILRQRLSTLRLSPPKEYWFSQIFVFLAVSCAWYMNGISTLKAIAFLSVATWIFLWVIGFRPAEIREIMALLVKRK